MKPLKIHFFQNMTVRPDDVWVVTFPKCGTTWTQEMVWQVANNCDFERGKVNLTSRFPFLEFETLMDPSKILPGMQGFIGGKMFKLTGWWENLKLSKPQSWLGYRDAVDMLEDYTERRFIKSHIPLSLLPPSLLDTAKVVYVARNPKDVLVSYYHHHKLLKNHDFVGDLPQFAKWFIQDKVMLSPFFPHVEEAWSFKDNPNMLFLFYEEMKRDLRSVIGRVSDFLGKELSEEQVNNLVVHLDIKNFRKNPAVNLEFGKDLGVANQEGSFIRKGQVGGWKEEFQDFPEMEKEVNNWVEENMKKSKVQYI